MQPPPALKCRVSHFPASRPRPGRHGCPPAEMQGRRPPPWPGAAADDAEKHPQISQISADWKHRRDVITCVVAKRLWRQFFFGVRRRIAAFQSGAQAPHSKKCLQVIAYPNRSAGNAGRVFTPRFPLASPLALTPPPSPPRMRGGEPGEGYGKGTAHQDAWRAPQRRQLRRTAESTEVYFASLLPLRPLRYASRVLNFLCISPRRRAEPLRRRDILRRAAYSNTASTAAPATKPKMPPATTSER